MLTKTQKLYKKIISCLLIIFLIISPLMGFAQAPLLDISLSMPLSGEYQPYSMVGFQVFKDNPLHIQFLMEQGEDLLNASEKKVLYEKLIGYFLTSLTIPNQEMWVNLSPFESDRILSESFAKTQMSGEFLQQDYLLKTITSALLNPQFSEGKKFWAEVYQKVDERYGSVDIPVDVFNKVWIVPERAFVYQEEGKVLITDSHLKVMLESDYLAMKSEINQESNVFEQDNDETVDFVKASMREVILPILEREVNQGAHFVVLRQMYHAMLLATYFKEHFQSHPLYSFYVDQAKIKGIEEQNPRIQTEVYQQYIQSYQKGVFDIVHQDSHYDDMPRKYMAGGLESADASRILRDSEIGLKSMSLVDILDVSLDINASINFYNYITFYVMQLEKAQVLVRSQGTYKIEPIVSMDSVGKAIIHINVLFHDHDQQEHIFYAVMRFFPDGKNINDVHVFVEDSYSAEGAILPQGDGIATWLYQELVKAMPDDGTLEEYVINFESRKFLAQRCFLKGNDVFFRDDSGGVKKIVLEAKQTNEISLEDILQQTLMGHLLSKAGLTHLRLRYGGYGFSDDPTSFGIEALKNMLEKVYVTQKDNSNDAFPLVPSFTLEAQKSDAAERLSLEDQKKVLQKTDHYIQGLKKAPPITALGREYFLTAFSRPFSMRDDWQELVIGFANYNKQGKERYLSQVMTLTVAEDGILNLDMDIKGSFIPEGQGLMKYVQKVITELTPDQDVMKMHVVNRETLQFLARRCFLNENQDIMFKDAHGKTQKVVEGIAEDETLISLVDVLKQTKVGALILKQEGIDLKEIYVASYEWKTEPIIFKNLEALKYLLKGANRIDALALLIHKLLPSKTLFSFIKKHFPLTPFLETPSFYLTAVKNQQNSQDLPVMVDVESFDKGGIDFALDSNKIQTTVKKPLIPSVEWEQLSDMQYIDGLRIGSMTIKPAFVYEVFTQK